MANNTSFVFYKSFFDAMQLLDNDDKCDYLRLICELAFNEVEADFTKSSYSDLVKVAYTISAEQIKASIQHKNDGIKGGRPRKENTEKGVKTPLLTPLLTNVNVNVKDNVKVKDNVNVSATSSSFLTPNDIYTLLSDYGYKFGESVLNKIILGVARFDDQKSAIIDRLNYIDSKYKGKTQDEKNGLFFKSLEWDEIPKTEKPKEKKLKIKPLKNCTFCGSSLVTGGIPNSLMCPNCEIKTFWEIDGNEWKCNRTS